MSRRKRRWYTSAEKSEMWDRWQRGESLNAIARAFETSHSTITKNLARHGGIRPPGRKRSRLALTLSEREEISRGIDGERDCQNYGGATGGPLLSGSKLIGVSQVPFLSR